MRNIIAIVCLTLAGLSLADAQTGPYPEKVPCPGVKAEIKTLNGSPAFFIDGKPQTGLMSHEQRPRPFVDNGQLVLTSKGPPYLNRSLVVNRVFDSAFTVDLEVSVAETVRETNGSFSIQVSPRAGRGGSYSFALRCNRADKDITLLKYYRDYERWCVVPFNWETGKVYRLKFVVNNGKLTGYVDGKLMAEHTDPEPLPGKYVALSVFNAVACVNEIKILDTDNKLLFEDDFSKINPDNWMGDGENQGCVKSLAKPDPQLSFGRNGVHLYHLNIARVC